jgi:hypothetical protein
MENVMWRIKWYIVRCLPRWIIEFAIIRAVTFATTGKYSNTTLPDLTAMDLNKRWRQQ